MEWYYIAAIAAVAVIALGLILRAHSGGQEEQPVPVPAQEALAAGASPAQAGNDEAVAAIIAAVVLSMWEGPGELVIRSIRRAGATESLWAQAGRQDLMK